MYLISAFIFALSANIDSFIIGMSCGIRKTRISVPKNILISLITLCGTLAALIMGSQICLLFAFPYAEYIGQIILSAFGLYYVLKFLILHCHSISSIKTSTEKMDTGKEEKEDVVSVSALTENNVYNPCINEISLTWKSALLLGLSLSANNLGIGMGASITGLKVLPTSLISFFLSVLFLYLGNRAGQSSLCQKSGRYADLFCGLLLILLGLI